ncbi:MAG: hypothetical protein M3Z24_15980 [Chloroflexota bacterium]|nr:hypothetical protein [Chloroflexota bacterium]
MQNTPEQNTNDNTTEINITPDPTETEQVPEQTSDGNETPQDIGFRPLTKLERRNLWLKEYGEQDFALQMWARLVEQQDLEIEMMFQMHGLLVFGVMVSAAHYAQFYIDLNEELHRQRDPDTADALREYYTALVPAMDQPQIGPEGLPIIFRYAHMRDVSIMSAGHKIKMPYWRGKIDAIDAFVVGATATE